MKEIRRDIPEPPPRIKKLEIDERGYPVPWFVSWVDGQPEFRVADGEKLQRCVREKRCWTCGDKLGRFFSFVIGPMCAVNRVSAEPPSHTECAEYAVRACPFMVKPQMVRRDNNLPPEAMLPAGEMIERNPGVTLLWDCRSYTVVPMPGGILFNIGNPTNIRCYARGRIATKREVLDSIETGLPILMKSAEAQGSSAVAALMAAKEEALKKLGLVNL